MNSPCFETLTFLVRTVLGFIVLALHERELPAEREVLLFSIQCRLLRKEIKKKRILLISITYKIFTYKIFIIPVNFKDLEKRKDEALILSKINI